MRISDWSSDVCSSDLVLVIDASTLTPLIPGVDYRVQSSPAIDPDTGVPLNVLRTRMLIEPLKPLKTATQYLVVVPRQVTSTDGVPVEAARPSSGRASGRGRVGQTVLNSCVPVSLKK